MINADTELLFLLFIWVVVFTIILIKRLQLKYSGLSIMFIMSLCQLYFFGALAYSIPGNYLKDLDITLIGFEQATIAIVSFCIANIFVGPFLTNHNKNSIVIENYPSRENLNIVIACLFVGILSMLGFFNFMFFIPTLRALLIAMQSLLLGALCLLSWHFFLQGKKLNIITIVTLSFLFPVFTVINLGFLGTGIIYTMIILIFTYRLWYPKWQFILLIIVMFYLAFGFYQTYRRERSDIREVVWSSSSFVERVNSFLPIIYDYEFFSPFNPQHVSNIDDRLNFNYLLGTAVERIEHKTDYANGSTFVNVLYALVPRIIWPEKPVRAGDDDLLTEYTGIKFKEGTSVGMGYIMEFYINYGWIAVFVGFSFLGLLIYILDYQSGKALNYGNYKKFLLFFLPGLTFLAVGTNIVQTSASAGASLAVCYFLFAIPKSKFKIIILFCFTLFIAYSIRSYYLPIISPIITYLKYIISIVLILFLAYLIILTKRSKY